MGCASICLPILTGFGSLIRAMGTHINRSGNKNACRDLSGRRVRDVKAEEKCVCVCVCVCACVCMLL